MSPGREENTLVGPDFFDSSRYYTGPPLSAQLVSAAEETLGRRLPADYLELLSIQNGGTPKSRCFRTDFPTSWAEGHFEISGIRGLGGPWGIDSASGLSSPEMIAEWGYPDVGVVLCDMPSGGHDAVMLDYSASPDQPRIIYVDEDLSTHVVAASFSDFISRLVDDGSCQS